MHLEYEQEILFFKIEYEIIFYIMGLEFELRTVSCETISLPTIGRNEQITQSFQSLANSVVIRAKCPHIQL
jgi:hypothetical protein